MDNIREHIELLVNDFEVKLAAIGINDTSAAMLLQIQFADNCYIKHLGNLNNLSRQITFLSPSANIEDKDFYVFFASEIELMPVAESTKINHRDTLRLLRKFNQELYFSQLNYELLTALDAFMVKEDYAINTIARHMKVLKQYINRAIVLEYIQTTPFRKYKIRSAETERESLSEKELYILQEYREQLEVRNEILDAFLFSCYSGLRYSDMRRLTKQHIVMLNRKRWIVIRMQKTDTEIHVPIYKLFEGMGLKLIKEIKRSRGIVFRLPDNQTVNRELKKIFKKLKIRKHITFHSARHTFATLLLYDGANITTVQTMLGHKSVKTTQIYSAVTDLTIDKEIKRIYAKKNRKGNTIIKKSRISV